MVTIAALVAICSLLLDALTDFVEAAWICALAGAAIISIAAAIALGAVISRMTPTNEEEEAEQ